MAEKLCIIVPKNIFCPDKPAVKHGKPRYHKENKVVDVSIHAVVPVSIARPSAKRSTGLRTIIDVRIRRLLMSLSSC
jgi:hypothetical protein